MQQIKIKFLNPLSTQNPEIPLFLQVLEVYFPGFLLSTRE